MKEQLLEAGEIVGTHGVRGEVKIMPWADSPEFLLGFDMLYLDGAAYAGGVRPGSQDLVLAKLRGVDDVDAAQTLRGKTVKIDRTSLELEEGAVFIADLIGLPVFAGGRGDRPGRGRADHARQRRLRGPRRARVHDTGGLGISGGGGRGGRRRPGPADRGNANR